VSDARSPDVDPHVVTFSSAALAGSTGAFILAGAVASIFGPLLVTFSHHFSVSLARAGWVLTVFSFGDLVGVVLAWRGVERLRGGVVLAGHLALIAVGALFIALAHSFAVLLASTLAIGLGFGGVDFSLNTLLTRTRVEGRARRLTVVNSGFGVGAVLGPLLVVALRPTHYRTLVVVLMVAALALAPLTRGITASPLAHVRAAAPGRRGDRRRILVTFVVAYVLYIAVETSATGWMAAQVHHAGHSLSVGSLVTAGFWAGVALGRGAGGAWDRRLGDVRTVLVGLGAGIALALVALIPDAALAAYPLMGLALAAVFPMGLNWYTRLVPGDSDGVALIIVFMFAGGVLGPGLESLIVSLSSAALVPLGIAAMALADLCVFASARRFASGDS
jgi:fucose permease